MKHKLWLIGLLIFTSSFTAVNLHSQECDYGTSEEIEIAPPPDPLATYELPAFTFATDDKKPHFVKIILVLGFDNVPELKEEIISRKDEIQHIISVLLHGKKYKDLDSVEDTINLTEEIKAHINAGLMSGKIREIYLAEFTVN